MASIRHRELGVDDGIHVLPAWVVADAAALAALTPTAEDVMKAAYQADTQNLYILVDDAPVTWKLLSSASLATAAQASADAAQDDATLALANAATAQSTANTAVANAATAQATADAAQPKFTFSASPDISGNTTLDGADRWKIRKTSGSGNHVISISGDGRHAANEQIAILHRGTGTPTYLGIGGMTVNDPTGTAQSLFDQGSPVVILFESATVCHLIGRLTPV